MHDGNDVAVTTTSVVGPETVGVAGTHVDTIKVHFDHQLSGSSNGYQRGDAWVRVSDGVLVRFVSEIDADAQLRDRPDALPRRGRTQPGRTRTPPVVNRAGADTAAHGG